VLLLPHLCVWVGLAQCEAVPYPGHLNMACPLGVIHWVHFPGGLTQFCGEISSLALYLTPCSVLSC
jgi:hypothetical protein